MPKYKFARDSLQDYYFDSDLQRVVSMKRGKPHLMTWSKDRSGREYVALQSSYGKSIFRRAHIRRSLKDRPFKVVSHKNFRTVSSKNPAAIFPITKKVADVSVNPATDKYVIGWTDKNDSWNMDTKQTIWSELANARIWAEQQAKKYTDRKYRVLKISGTVEVSDVIWS